MKVKLIMDKSKLSRAQSQMTVCAGIALGIRAALEGYAVEGKSFFENAVNFLSETEDQEIQGIVKELQEYINEQYEIRRMRLLEQRSSEDKSLGVEKDPGTTL